MGEVPEFLLEPYSKALVNLLWSLPEESKAAIVNCEAELTRRLEPVQSGDMSAQEGARCVVRALVEPASPSSTGVAQVLEVMWKVGNKRAAIQDLRSLLPS